MRTTCCYCGTGCGIEVSRDARGRLSLRGDAEHPINRGQLCTKGATLLEAVAARAERLLHPHLRLTRTASLHRASWDDALDHIASQWATIRAAHGPDALGVYASGQMLTEDYYVLNKLVKGFLGTNNLDTNSRLCMSSAVAGYTRTLGTDSPPCTYEDIDAADTILVAGANPAWAHPIVWRRVEARKASHPECRLIVVDPRRTASCTIADLHLQLRPGTDVALHLALARRLIEIGGIDRPFIERHTHGWAELEVACAPWTLAAAAAHCGVPAADIDRAAGWIAGDRRFLSLWTMGLNQSTVGVDKTTSLITLSLITGKIGRPGCGPFSLTGQPNAMGGREVGGMATLAAAHRSLANPAHRAEIAAHWGVPTIPSQPGLTAVELFQAAADGRVKALWIIATNPVESMPDARLVERALARAELVVVQDIYPTATTALADVVLPAATWLEKRGTMTSSDRRLSLLTPLVEPPGESLPDHAIFCRLAARLGWGDAFAWVDEAAIFAEHAALTRGRDCDYSGVSHARLAQRSLQWPVPTPEHPGTPRLFEDGRFATPDGRARLAAPRVVHRAEPTSEAFPLVLTTGRLRDQWHTMTRTGRIPALTGHERAPLLDLHPADAHARGIAEGQIVTVASLRGEVQVQARLTEGIRPGVVFLPMHWGRQLAGERGRTNTLTSPRTDPISHEPDLKQCAVQVAAFRPPARQILVIGGGAAARALVEAHAAHGLADRITILGEEPEPIYHRVDLPLLIEGSRTFAQLVRGTPESLQAQGACLRAATRAVRIDRATRTVEDAEGVRHRYDVLVLATGSRAARHFQGRLPPRGVHTLRTHADAQAIRAAGGAGRTAIVIGGGVLGLELADALIHLGTTVRVLQRGGRLMARQLDARASGMVAAHLRDRGIDLRFDATIEEVQGEAQVTGVRLASGETLACDLLIFATGTAPNAELARAAVLRCSTGILVDEHLQTSDPHIFAIGEVAEFRGALAGTTADAELQARHLSEWLRGNLHAPYPGPVNATILKIEGLPVASVGLVEAADAGAVAVVHDDPGLGIYRRCLVLDDRLVGVLLVGDTSAFPRLRELVTSGAPLGAQRRTLLGADAAEAPIEGALICTCNRVGATTIARAIERRLHTEGACTLETVGADTRAGTSCGSCRPEIQQLLQRRQPP